MEMSFYVGAIGADNCLNKLSVVSNNLANVNNTGFKPKTAVFSELINYNLNDDIEAVTELQAGAGMRVQRTYTPFEVSAFQQTGDLLNYALGERNTFFMVQDVATGAISYTRDGNFHRGEINGVFYLTAKNGKLVLDENQQPIELLMPRTDENGQVIEEEDDRVQAQPGIVTFDLPSRLLSIGDNEYVPSDEGVEPIPVESPYLETGYLEASGVNVASEYVKMIEAQRAFTYALKMVQTSDETVQTVNSLRG